MNKYFHITEGDLSLNVRNTKKNEKSDNISANYQFDHFCYLIHVALGFVQKLEIYLHFYMISWLQRAFLPHSWEYTNHETNFSQMLHSARIYQLPLTNGLCCIQTTDTVQNHIGNVIT